MRTAFAIVALLAVGCVQPLRLVKFHAPAGEADPMDQVVRSLVENGQQPAEVDGKTGIIHTEWQDTGFMYGQIRNETATIYRRYTAIVTRANGGADIVLRLDTRRCTGPHVTSTTTGGGTSGGTTVSVGNRSVTFGGTPNAPAQVVTHVDQPCEPMEGVVESHQEELDTLGRQLRAALGARPNAG